MRKISLSKRTLNYKGKYSHSDETLKKFSEQRKGKPAHNKGVAHPEEGKRKNMVWHLKIPDITLEDLSKYLDYNKLKFLNSFTQRNAKFFSDKKIYLSFLDKFYFCSTFNFLYERWIKVKNKWYMPSLDHIVPISRGGGWEIENLTFMTLFENKAKHNMTPMEWAAFKKQIEINSDLFV